MLSSSFNAEVQITSVTLDLMVGNVWLALVVGFNIDVSSEVFVHGVFYSMFDSINTECAL